MSPERWNRIERLFEEAAQLPPEQRAVFLERACADDAALRQEVEALLTADPLADDFLDALGADVVAPVLDEALASGDPMLGQTIGPYRLEARIGRGGMGTVYRASRADGAFDQTVALKVVRRDLSDELAARFRSERQILAHLEHPSIAHLFDGGVTTDGRPWLAMEFVEGEPITEYADRQRLDVNARLALFASVCDAVSFAHRRLVVHRDLKPSNILVNRDGHVKLLDFGIAKLLEEGEEPAITQAGGPMTPEYAAPEQVRGESITVATDVYALGVLLYELLTGRRPYRIPSRVRHEIERVILEEEPTRPSTAVQQPLPAGASRADTATPETLSDVRRVDPVTLRRRLAGDLDVIVLKALRKEPEMRYASANALERDVVRHLEGRPVEARPPTLGYRTGRFVRRHRWGVAAVSLLALSLIGGLGASMWQANRAATEADRARDEAATAEAATAVLARMLESASPMIRRGETPTVEDLVDRAAAEMDTALIDQPRVRARLLQVLGGVYMSQGRHQQAAPLLDEAVELRVRLYGEMHEETFQARRRKAAYYRTAGQLAEAESVYVHMLATLEPHRRNEQVRVGTILADLAEIRKRRSDTAEALAHLREAEQIFRKLGPAEASTVRTILMSQASVYMESGNADRAEPLFREVMDATTQDLEQPDLGTLIRMSNLGVLYRQQGRYDESEGIYDTILPIYRRYFDPDHPTLAYVLLSYGSTLRVRGEPERAVDPLQEAYSIHSARHGHTHPFTVEIGLWLGQTLNDLERHHEALPLLETAADVFAQTRGSDNAFTRAALQALATSSEGLGRTRQAEQYRLAARQP